MAKELGEYWHTMAIRTKMHACFGGAHDMIEAVASLQEKNPEKMANLELISHTNIRLSKSLFAHSGWKADVRPMTATGGQMNAGYICAVQLVDKMVLLSHFATSELD